LIQFLAYRNHHRRTSTTERKTSGRVARVVTTPPSAATGTNLFRILPICRPVATAFDQRRFLT
ncbi:MAG: hypothetical protein ACK5YO_05930, partial [Planctomyces sp.]